jgi:hypothetical protein
MATERLFPSSGAAPAIGRGLVASSFQYYLSGEESLRIETLTPNAAGTRVQVSTRLWRESDRQIQIEREEIVGTAAGTQTDFPLDAGALLNLRIGTTTSTVAYGRVFVRAQLVRGSGAAATIVGTLLQGYISAQQDLAWPGSPIEKMRDAPGVVINPGWTVIVGPALLMVVPAKTRYRVLSGRFVFSTLAFGGNREIILGATDDAGLFVWVGVNSVTVGPGATLTYAFCAGQSASAIVGAGNTHLPWPADLELTAGMTVQAIVVGGTPFDTFTSTALLVREWMDQ